MTQDFEIKENEVVIKKDEEPINDDLMKAAIQAHTELEKGKGLSFANIFIAGANWQKEQMMKGAIDGFISNDLIGKFLHFDTLEFNVAGLKFQEGDKVKIIIVKEE